MRSQYILAGAVVVACVLSLFAFTYVVFGVEFSAVVDGLENDTEFQHLLSAHPARVSKYVDGYGVVFYAVDCSNDCVLQADNK